MLNWIFDPLPPSGQIQGSPPLLHTLGSDFSIDVLVREIIQNSYDQIPDGAKGKVKFSLYRLDGKDKNDFLSAISWPSLKSHISADQDPSPTQKRLSEGLEYLENNQLTLLRIDDTGTYGLTGEEAARDGNFNKLCRHLFVTSESQQARLGSYGLGKGVLWIYSSLLTVLFSSRIEGKDPQPGFRLFGRSELPFHRTKDGDEWAGSGFYGEPHVVANGKRANSVWDDKAEKVAKESYLYRPDDHLTGTTILILGFFERDQDEQRALPEIATDILESAVRWFWAPIKDQTLAVSAEAHEGGKRIYSGDAQISGEVVPFVEMYDATTTVPRILLPGQIAERTLPFTIPQRADGKGKKEIKANLTIRIRRPIEGESLDLRNSIALMRSPGMVVDYKSPGRHPLDGQPYHAILLAGTARGNSTEDQAMFQFLRATEPPTHNRWIHTADRVKAEYRAGAKIRLSQLWSQIDQAIVELSEEPPAKGSLGPRRLAALFPLGGGGGGKTGEAKFKLDQRDATLEGAVWRFSGRITRLGDPQTAWGFRLGLELDAESKVNQLIDIKSLELSAGAIIQKGDRWICEVPASIDEVNFEGESVAGATGVNGIRLHRTPLLLDVQAMSLNA